MINTQSVVGTGLRQSSGVGVATVCLFLVMYCSSACNVLQAADPRPIVQLEADGDQSGDLRTSTWLSFSPNGKWLAVRCCPSDGVDRIHIWNSSTWHRRSFHLTMDLRSSR